MRHLPMLCLLTLCACSKADSDNVPTVYVAVPPLASTVERVTAGQWAVGSLVRAGQDPHALALTPAEASALAHADLFLAAGMHIEEALLDRVEGPRIVHVNPLSPMEAGDHRDEHIWLNPDRLTAFAKGAVQAISEADPAHADRYHAGLNSFVAQVASAVDQARMALKPYQGRRFYVQHGAFGHYAAFFGIEQVALEQEGREARARDLRDLVEQAKKDGVRVIWVQPQRNSAPARELARALGAEVRELDPIPADPIVGLIQIARQLAEGFALEDQE